MQHTLFHCPGLRPQLPRSWSIYVYTFSPFNSFEYPRLDALASPAQALKRRCSTVPERGPHATFRLDNGDTPPIDAEVTLSRAALGRGLATPLDARLLRPWSPHFPKLRRLLTQYYLPLGARPLGKEYRPPSICFHVDFLHSEGCFEFYWLRLCVQFMIRQ